jgi:hypothetical protein
MYAVVINGGGGEKGFSGTRCMFAIVDGGGGKKKGKKKREVQFD